MGVTVFSPAKLNLFLAITGRRADGFHDLVSVAAPLDFGDELVVDETTGGAFTLETNAPDLPVDETNLVLRAAKRFAEVSGWRGGARFRLQKRIPVGAGLGGGSSNAVAALRALQQIAGQPLAGPQLAALAAELGSDCALFLHGAPVVMRGRGERVEPLPPAAAARLRGRRVLLGKPSFGIATPWAYGRMVARGGDYLPAPQAEEKLSTWLNSAAVAEELLFNNMEPAAFEKYLALPMLLARLRQEFGVAVGMSGSGSACFALLGEKQDAAPLVARVRECWGDAALAVVTRMA